MAGLVNATDVASDTCARINHTRILPSQTATITPISESSCFTGINYNFKSLRGRRRLQCYGSYLPRPHAGVEGVVVVRTYLDTNLLGR